MAGEKKADKSRKIIKWTSRETETIGEKQRRGRGAVKVAGMLVKVGAAVIVSQFIVGYPMLWILGRDNFVEPVWQAVYSALSYLLALGLIIFVPRKNTSRKELELVDLPTWTDIGLAPIGFIVYLLLAAGITALFTIFPWFNVEEAQDVGFNLLANGTDRIVAFITLVVVAPIAEEIIFRGWLYGKLRRHFSNATSGKIGMALAIFLTSLVFGIVHLQWNVGVNVFAMSVVLCGLREITGTIYAGMLLHILKNGVAFYLLYISGM